MPKYPTLLALVLACILPACQSTNLDEVVGSITRAGSSIESVRTGDLVAAGQQQFKAGNFGKSYELYKKAAEAYPQNPSAWLGLAASADQLGRFDTSDQAYRALAMLAPDSPAYQNNLGYSYMLRGDLKSAQSHLLKAQGMAPSNLVVMNNLRLLDRSTSLARHG
ncbi:tetratricopeptide repeat protein [Consotaella salsifontis]|uniref:Tetratricopeptide repeat-containing protein n=1 Tax=Consotaella salsifontis TaxID=1365950 RepID=A0A1T4PVE6_9HYPH|nr:tetratricopeptide repeat protein [Consotaella salsifontis]SJZ95336.1 Tetratricopeptide repeat-containing protein [Consotaella salsifontis]